MKKTIVTTTIQNPTAATLKFCEITKRKGSNSWNFVIVGDKKTPNDAYRELEKEYPNLKYLDASEQEQLYPKLSEVTGWNCIQRRNLGFVYAYKELESEVIATVDDDNIPYDNWGQNIFVNQEVEVDLYQPEAFVFDPLSITEHKSIWHRGYPIDLLQQRLNVEYKGKFMRKCLVQADLWDGDPDVDAMVRLIFKPLVKFEKRKPWSSNAIMPFNSQNTFLSRTVMPYYAVLPYAGRMDDIWAAYILQKYFPNCVVFNNATVYQDRNPQDLVKNLENEIIGYRETCKFVANLNHFIDFLPPKTAEFYKVYREQFSQ